MSAISTPNFAHATDSGDPFGTIVGSYNGVTAYSNYDDQYFSYEYNYVDGYNTGMKWQCVEYVNRYYYLIYGLQIRIPGTNAIDYYDTASQRGLVAYSNKGTTSPQPGDILCSNGKTTQPPSKRYGHVAIVRDVTNDSVHVIHQNWTNTGADNDKSISMKIAGGHYIVSGFSSSYPVQGWLRRPPEVTILQGALYPYPNTFSPGQVITFVYSINNPTVHNIPNVRLGAQIRKSQPQGVWIDDPSRDKVVTLQPGAHDYSRDFQIPSSATPGLYDGHWVILHHDTGVPIDSLQKTRILRITGSPAPPEQQVIRDAYKEIETAIENEDINTLMSYFSFNFLHSGQNRDYYQSQFQALFDNYQNIQVQFSNLDVTINGNVATTSVHVNITAEPQGGGATQTIVDADEFDKWHNYWIKEKGFWRLYGDQQTEERVSVDIDTKYWEDGSYDLRITAHGTPGDISSITISGPHIDTATVHMGGGDPDHLYDDGNHGDEEANDGIWWVLLDIVGIPAEGETIIFDIAYSDGSSETKQKSIDGVLSETAQLLSPLDGFTVNTLTPTFEWSNPSVPGLTYSVQVDDINHNRLYDVCDLPDGTTSHEIPADYLNWETTYYWLVSASDVNGNEALTNWDTFTTSEERVSVDVETKYWEVGNYQLRITAQASPGDVLSITITGPSYLDTATVNKPGDPESSDNPKQLYDDGQHWDGEANDGLWWVELNIDTSPTTSDTITFHITYTDGSTETKQKTIDGVPSETAQLLSPPDGSTVSTLTPTFEWSNPSISGLTYSVQVNDANYRIYDVYNLPDGTTSHTIPSGYLSWGTEYYWLVSASDANGNEALTNWDTFTTSGTAASTTRAIGQPKFGLSQNYPNPCNPETTIKYGIAEDCAVTLKIYNLAGQLIKTLVDEYQTAGYYTITWFGDSDAGQEVASGVYFYRIKAGDFVSTKKMVVLK